MSEQTELEANKLAAFEARIMRGEKIEPGDWMPEAYRKQLIRKMAEGLKKGGYLLLDTKNRDHFLKEMQPVYLLEKNDDLMINLFWSTCNT